MKFASYNIQYGKGKDHRYDLARIADEVREADVIALQEVERFWQRSGMVDQPAVLASLLDEHWWVYGAGVDLALENAAPGDTRRRQFGNMLLARRPILMSRNHLLPKYSTTGPMSIQRAALEGVIAFGGGHLRVYSVHLTHLSSRTRLPQVKRLLQLHRDAVFEGSAVTGELVGDWAHETPSPVMPDQAVIMGDFNFEYDSKEYEAIVGPVSDYGGRLSNLIGFVDTWPASGHDLEGAVTADVRGRPVKLDYCFVSTSLAGRLTSARIDAVAQGSDHQPIWVELEESAN